MTLRGIAAFALWFALAGAASGQQKSEAQAGQGPPQKPAESTYTRSYADGNTVGSKVVRTRTESAGREIVTEVSEAPGATGRFEPSMKTVTETTGNGSDSVKVKREVFGNGAQGALTLLETSVSDQQTSADGTSRTVTNSWVPDLSGRLNLSYRQVEERKSAGPDVQQTETTIYRPGVNEALSEAERIQKTERRLGPGLDQTDSRRDLRDANGRWQTIGTRSREVRTISPAEVLEEESVRSLNSDGTLTVSERTITRRSKSNGSDQVVTELYSPFTPGVAAEPGRPLALGQRVRVTTTPTADGGSQTISETESQVPGYSGGPFKVVARTVETVRQIKPDVWERQRQLFAIDGSGRLVLTMDEKEATRGK